VAGNAVEGHRRGRKIAPARDRFRELFRQFVAEWSRLAKYVAPTITIRMKPPLQALRAASATWKNRTNQCGGVFEGEFSGNVTSYAGKGVVKYSW
jgi:hypothetical protein